ncbi:XamI family restriction endonuclease [Acidovorax sp. SUPP1855]|uniref:XamI family restriction endonuclease n=1 Tax=Acidovorax sp. SUPP1855 TaxID=431774 RepID=UPI0024E0D2F5|nr:XamI family restriction endonuclease [Acidovorax sp. SUPP1855]
MPAPDDQAMPSVWTTEQIREDAAAARAEFRSRRLDEPLRDYLEKFPAAKAAADVVVSQMHLLLTRPVNKELAAGIVGNKHQFAALRSLAAVPISEDDLDTLLDASLNRTALKRSQELADKLGQLLTSSLDPKRFPWVEAGRAATPEELESAQLATALITAVSAVQAGRRGEESKALEGKVAEILDAAGYTQVTKLLTGIKRISHFPEAGTYMRQTALGGHNADYVVRLFDGRLLALECKASNSAVNGFKRLNKEVVVDAGDWHREFGRSSVVAAAAIRGVFKADNVATAQSQNVFVFWWHKMDVLADFLASAS